MDKGAIRMGTWSADIFPILATFARYQLTPGSFCSLGAVDSEHASDETVLKKPRDACARIWDHIEPSLPPYLQRLATDVGYLRLTKEEADKDRQARQIEFDEWEERVFDDPDNIFDSQSYRHDQVTCNDTQLSALEGFTSMV